MLGTIVNTATIVFGGSLGSGLGSRLNKKYGETLLNAVAVTVVIIGLKSALQTNNLLLMILSMAGGSIIGEFLRIEDSLNGLSKSVEKKFSSYQDNLAEGFVTATLIFCVGSMSVVGAIESGVHSNHNILFTKSILDGISSLVLSSTLGIGVVLSAISVFIYQGLLTLISGVLASYLPMEAFNELSAVGGVLVMVLGLNMLKITNIRVSNMLPAIFIPVVYVTLKTLIVF